MNIINLIFEDSPKLTKILTFMCLTISLATWFELVSPLSLYLNYDLVVKKYQVIIINNSFGD